MIGKWLRRRKDDEHVLNYAIGSGEWKYVGIPAEDVLCIVRNAGKGSNRYDEIRIKRGAEIVLLLDPKEWK